MNVYGVNHKICPTDVSQIISDIEDTSLINRGFMYNMAIIKRDSSEFMIYM
jgi:hypothetical protein